jgi:hypothetical protein
MIRPTNTTDKAWITLLEVALKNATTEYRGLSTAYETMRGALRDVKTQNATLRVKNDGLGNQCEILSQANRRMGGIAHLNQAPVIAIPYRPKGGMPAVGATPQELFDERASADKRVDMCEDKLKRAKAYRATFDEPGADTKDAFVRFIQGHGDE